MFFERTSASTSGTYQCFQLMIQTEKGNKHFCFSFVGYLLYFSLLINFREIIQPVVCFFLPEQVVMKMSLIMEIDFSFPPLPGRGQAELTGRMQKLGWQKNLSCPVQHLAISVQKQDSHIQKSFISTVYLKTELQVSCREFPALHCFHQALLKVLTLKVPRELFLHFLCCFFIYPIILSLFRKKNSKFSGIQLHYSDAVKRLKKTQKLKCCLLCQQPEEFSYGICGTK